MAKLAAIQELRARLGAQKAERETYAWSRLPGGVPRGGLMEIAGPGKTEAAAHFLAEQLERTEASDVNSSKMQVAWIEADFTLLPSALPQRNLPLEKLFFVEGKNQSAWAATLILRSQLFPFVVYHANYEDEKELRRFQLLAERSRSTMLLLGAKPSLAWPISLSLALEKGALQLKRRK